MYVVFLTYQGDYLGVLPNLVLLKSHLETGFGGLSIELKDWSIIATMVEPNEMLHPTFLDHIFKSVKELTFVLEEVVCMNIPINAWDKS